MWSYLFSQDSKVIRYKGFEILVRPGDCCHVRSQRYDCYFTDGYIKALYTNGIEVAYGFDKYFSGFFTRGNTKIVSNSDITKILRFPDASIVRQASATLSPDEKRRLELEGGSDSDSPGQER